MSQCHEAECGLEMLTADGCTITCLSFESGEMLARHRYGSPEDLQGYVTPDELDRCHDCNCKPGEYHHVGCDAERCPKCGRQLISCNDRIFDVHTAIPKTLPTDHHIHDPESFGRTD